MRPRNLTMYRKHRYQINGILIGGALTAVNTLFIRNATNWDWYLAWLLSINIITFATFGMDKQMAKSGTVRVPESVLHVFTLAGGAIGQLIGRALFHHKTNIKAHPAFLIVPIISLILHGGILFWIYGR